MRTVIRFARDDDIGAMRALIFEHGANQWNFLPEEEVTVHIAAIASGKTEAVLAEVDGVLAGFVTFLQSRAMARYQPQAQKGFQHGYICEAVVHRQFAGKGLGSALLQEAVRHLLERGMSEIYIERHEENLASAGMMRKAGFREVDTFDDPTRRASGSRRTTVCRIMATETPCNPC